MPASRSKDHLAAPADQCRRADGADPSLPARDDRARPGPHSQRRLDRGVHAGPRLAAYAASKAYVLSLTESLSEELGGTGVTATALCPGFTDTAMVRGSRLGEGGSGADDHVAEGGRGARLRGVPQRRGDLRPGLANRALTSGAPLLPRALVRAIGGMATVRGWGGMASAFFGGGAPGSEGQEMTAVQANGITIEYQEIGPPDAPVILLIMGLGMQLDGLAGAVLRGPCRPRFPGRPLRQSRRRPVDPDAVGRLARDPPR